jgi:hypothetical protein
MNVRALGLAAVTTVLTAQVAWVAPVAAASGFDPSVATIVLQTGPTKVVSSTDHRLRVQLTATHPVGYDDHADQVAIAVLKGSSGSAETHRWSFDVPAAAWDVDATGAGTIDVPKSAIAPFGKVRLTVRAVGDPTTQSCNGTVRSQTQKVSVGGTVFFDTRSKGAHRWGTVGSKSKRFAFAAPSTLVTTDDLPATPCVGTGHAPCLAQVVWSAASPKVNLEGANTSNTRGSLLATRTKHLASPANATRTDVLRATTRQLAVKTGAGGGAGLAVVAAKRASGSAKLTAAESSAFSAPCTKDGTDHTQTYTTWDADYTNGAKPLAAHAQVFGAIKLGDMKGPGNASFSTVTYA